MAEPRELVDSLERSARLAPGTDERFEGYGVMSAPFAGGDTLAMRRFPATSVGPAYTSVWHRAPDGAWTFYQDADPALACPRYFSAALADIRRADVGIEWTGPRRFNLTVKGPSDLRWDVSLSSSPATRVMNTVAAVVPAGLWRNSRFLKVMGIVAGVVLKAGKLGLAGKVPNGQWFIANPRLVWVISASSATLDGHDFGPMGEPEQQSKLGDFWIPKSGLFAIGRAFFEPYDVSRHKPLPVAMPGEQQAV